MAKNETELAASRLPVDLAMRWSVGVSFGMVVVKVAGYLLTNSAAVLSDASESIVHIVGVLFAAYSLRFSHKPADDTHRYGHAKIGFFSAGVEGTMIVIAALFIYLESIRKLVQPEPLTNLPAGLVLSGIAAVGNGILGLYLLRSAKKHHSLILEANGKHTLSDCWTSLAVLLTLFLTGLLHWTALDPVIGMLVATSIVYTGIRLVHSSFSGLMDEADPKVQKLITEILDRETQHRNISYHNLRHRNLGDTQWVEFHLVFPTGVLLSDAHRIATEIEDVLGSKVAPKAKVTTHLESALDHHILHQEGD
ncbi:MAG TPA: cation diffusion facilitator family transporter [Chthoniobacterales bacterium]|nr:cation diffusion facilitator family transporter [Chthoniobacterales bacterium]